MIGSLLSTPSSGSSRAPRPLLPPARPGPPSPTWPSATDRSRRSEEHTFELQSRVELVCRLLLEKKKKTIETSSRESEKAPKYESGYDQNRTHLRDRMRVLVIKDVMLKSRNNFKPTLHKGNARQVFLYILMPIGQIT